MKEGSSQRHRLLFGTLSILYMLISRCLHQGGGLVPLKCSTERNRSSIVPSAVGFLKQMTMLDIMALSLFFVVVVARFKIHGDRVGNLWPCLLMMSLFVLQTAVCKANCTSGTFNLLYTKCKRKPLNGRHDVGCILRRTFYIFYNRFISCTVC